MYDEEYGKDEYFNDFYPHALGVLKDNEFIELMESIKR